MGTSEKEKIDVVIQIDAKAYYEYPYALKSQAAEAVGAVNAWYRGKGKKILLMTPGRVGTSSPELGVPVSFAQISGFRGICEVSDSRAGYMPELSTEAICSRIWLRRGYSTVRCGAMTERSIIMKNCLPGWRIFSRRSVRTGRCFQVCSG